VLGTNNHNGPKQHNVVHIHISTTAEKTEWSIDMQNDTSVTLSNIPVVIQNTLHATASPPGDARLILTIPNSIYRLARMVLAIIGVLTIMSALLGD